MEAVQTGPRQNSTANSRLFLRIRFSCVEPNLVQKFRLTRDLRLADRKPVAAQKVSQDIGLLLPIHARWLVLRHGSPDALEQIAERQAIPVRKERVACQCRSFTTTLKRVAMAR